MPEITLHTGCMGDETTIWVDWFDENNVKHKTKVRIWIKYQDMPRTLLVSVDEKCVAEVIRSGDVTLISRR